MRRWGRQPAQSGRRFSTQPAYKQPTPPADSGWSDRVFDEIVIDSEAPVSQVSLESIEVGEKVQNLFVITQLVKVFDTYETVDRALLSYK